MEKKLKKYAHESMVLDVNRNEFILDYDACGVDMKLHAAMDLFGKLIKKHFTIAYTLKV